MNRTQVSAKASPRCEIRQARNTDRPALAKFLTGLSPHARYLRFFSGSAPTSEGMLRILTGGADYLDALVATENDVIIGHAMAADLVGPDGARLAEIGVVVADSRRGLGVGSGLMRMLIARTQSRGVTAMVMEVLAENRQVLRMITDHWPVARQKRSGAYVTIHAMLPVPEEGHLPGSAGHRGCRNPGPNATVSNARPGMHSSRTSGTTPGVVVQCGRRPGPAMRPGPCRCCRC